LNELNVDIRNFFGQARFIIGRPFK